MIKRLILSVALVLGVMVAGHYVGATPVLAQAGCQIGDLSNCDTGTVLIPTGTICEDATGCISWFINVVFILATLATFLYLIWGGIKYITAGGSGDKVGEARSTITNAVIGLVVVILAWAITNFVLQFFSATDAGLPGSPDSGISPTTYLSE